MSFIKYLFTTTAWLTNREVKPLQEPRKRVNAYKHGMYISHSRDLPREATEHINKLELKRVRYEKESNSNPVYDQGQVDFWRNHTHELYSVVMNRKSAFGNASYSQSGLAINFLAA